MASRSFLFSSSFSSLSPLIPTALFLGTFLCLPLLIVLGISFSTRGMYGGVEWILTLDNYARLVDPLYGHIYLRSLGFAIGTTVLCLLLGYPMAYFIARSSMKWQNILLIMVMIPFWTNFLVRTYAWLFILRADGLMNTMLLKAGIISQPLELLYTDFAVFVGLVYGYLPFMILPLVVAIERIPHSLEEAAGDLYAGPWSIMWRVIVPLSKPGILAGCVLVFVPTLGSFITPYLLGGGHNLMIGTLIQQEFLVMRDWPFGAAASFMLMGMVLLAYVRYGKPVQLVGKE